MGLSVGKVRSGGFRPCPVSEMSVGEGPVRLAPRRAAGARPVLAPLTADPVRLLRGRASVAATALHGCSLPGVLDYRGGLQGGLGHRGPWGDRAAPRCRRTCGSTWTVSSASSPSRG